MPKEESGQQRVVAKKDFLGQILIKKNLMTAQQLEEALSIQKKEGGLLGDILVDKGFISEELLSVALAYQSDLCYVPVERYKIGKDAVRLVPRETAAKYKCIALEKIGGVLTVAMANPFDREAVRTIEAVTHYRVVCVIGAKSQIEKIIADYY